MTVQDTSGVLRFDVCGDCGCIIQPGGLCSYDCPMDGGSHPGKEQHVFVNAAEVERLLHGICDALKFLPSPRKSAGTAILRGLLKGTAHEGHDEDLWSE